MLQNRICELVIPESELSLASHCILRKLHLQVLSSKRRTPDTTFCPTPVVLFGLPCIKAAL